MHSVIDWQMEKQTDDIIMSKTRGSLGGGLHDLNACGNIG